MVRASARVETRILHTEESSTVQLSYTTAEEAPGAFDPQNVCFRSIAFLCTRAPALLQAPPTTWLVYRYVDLRFVDRVYCMWEFTTAT